MIRSLLAALLLAAPLAAQQRETVREITDARLRTNAAIAARDIDALAEAFLPTMVVTTGAGRTYVGRDSVLAVLRLQFADSAFQGYVRETGRVEVSSVLPMAAEHGEWVGRWRRDDGIQESRGTYLAMWRLDERGWRLQSELYVTLSCAGSRRCRPS